ncbi:hypothetical protein V8F06_000787 [Rhypophila decipiens]
MGMIQTESPYYQVAPCALCCGGELPGPHFEIDGTSDVWVYSLITKASIEMVSPYEGTAVLGVDNTINFCSVVMAWLGGAKDSGVYVFVSDRLSRLPLFPSRLPRFPRPRLSLWAVQQPQPSPRRPTTDIKTRQMAQVQTSVR